MKFYEKVSLIAKKIKPPYIQGRIIILNGASSSGKTSIAKLLREELMKENFYFHSLDDFLSFLLAGKRPSLKELESFLPQIPRIYHSFHCSITANAGAGNSIIVDHVLPEKEFLIDLIQCLNNLDCKYIIFVGVKCKPSVLEIRERNRPEKRESGLARYQAVRIHKYCVYDVMVDTSVLSTKKAVQKIMEFYVSGKIPKGIELTRKRLGIRIKSRRQIYHLF